MVVSGFDTLIGLVVPSERASGKTEGGACELEVLLAADDSVGSLLALVGLGVVASSHISELAGGNGLGFHAPVTPVGVLFGAVNHTLTAALGPETVLALLVDECGGDLGALVLSVDGLASLGGSGEGQLAGVDGGAGSLGEGGVVVHEGVYVFDSLEAEAPTISDVLLTSGWCWRRVLSADTGSGRLPGRRSLS